MSGKEFPNNWEDIATAPDDMFDTCTFIEMMEGLMSWSIPSSHCVIMRVRNIKTNKVNEFAYQKLGAARNKLIKLVDDPNNEVLICDNDSIHLIHKNDVTDFN